MARFSPFVENRLAVATAQNFGIIGNGRLHVLELSPGGGLVEVMAYDTADGLYDCCWSEANENLLVSASGDGSVKIWDLAFPPASNPIRSLEEHIREVQSVDWNVVRRDSFLSSSWDDTIKLWALESGQSLRTFREHTYCVYSAVWNPAHPDVFASASGDCTLRIWDLREPRSVLVLPAHDMEILSCDWNKYGGGSLIATASVDRTICMWDIRAPRPGPGRPEPLARLQGHAYAVRRVRCSPFHEPLLASASYDMTSFALDLALGGALGGVSHTIVAPIERVKLLLQTQDSNAAILAGQHRRYRGFVDAVTTIVKEEGFWALWRGNGTSVMRYYPSLALNFAFKDYYRVLFAPSHLLIDPSATRIAAGNFLAGAAAGATSLLVTYPLDVAHTRLATDIGTRRQFAGMRSVIAALWRAEGIKGLYRGFPASVHGIIVHRSLYFGGFDSAKQLLLKGHGGGGRGGAGGRGDGGEGGGGGGGAALVGGGTSGANSGVMRGEKGRAGEEDGIGNGDGLGHAPFWLRWMLAQAATTTASVVSYPFDTVRHRMMMQAGLAKPRRGEAGRAGPGGLAAVEAAAGAAGGAAAGAARGAGTVLSAVGSGGAAAGMGLAAAVAGAEATVGVNPVNSPAVASVHAAQTPNVRVSGPTACPLSHSFDSHQVQQVQLQSPALGQPGQPGQLSQLSRADKSGQLSQPGQPQGKAQQQHHQQQQQQQQQPGRKIVVFKSTWACWKHVYRQEGVLGFYKGLFSNILRGTGAAFILVMYDEVRQFVHGDKGL
ncbi:unnamed protein product [Closterium sp. NIES-64]|nr:unnamed protein product [Closterium sp. NIES-64]